MNFRLTRVFLAGIIVFLHLTSRSQQHINRSNPKVSLRTTNGCGVTASFTPDKDSVTATYFHVLLTNTSKNATKVVWVYNGWGLSADNTFDFNGSTPGIHEIKLIASNGTCSDTATAVYFYPGAQPRNRNNLKAYYGLVGVSDYSKTFCSLKEGGYLMGGYSFINSYGVFENALLIKITEAGCIEWSKTIPHKLYGAITKVVQTTDGNIAVAGYTNQGFYLMKLDKDGNLLWSRYFKLAGKAFAINCMTSTSDGGLVMAGQFGNTSDDPMGVIRTNSTGEVIWNRSFYKNSYFDTYHGPIDVLQQGTNIYVAANIYQDGYPIKPDTSSGILVKIDDITGNTTWTKKITINGANVNVRDIHRYGENLLVNIDGRGSSISAPNNSFMVLDKNDKVIKSATIVVANSKYQIDATTAMPLDNGDIYFLNSAKEILDLQPGFAYHSFFIRIDANNQVKWSKHYGSRGRGRYFYGAIGQNQTFAALGDELGSSYAEFGYLADKLLFSKIDSLGGNGDNSCGIYDTKVSVMPASMQTSTFTWNSDSIATSLSVDTILGVKTTYTSVLYKCPLEFIDSCSYIKVTGPADICNLDSTYLYKTHRNRTCNQPVVWDIPLNATVISSSDTALSLRFTGFGSYYVGAALPYTCSPVKDSVFVAVGSHTRHLNLGADTSLCANTSLALHATPSYAGYRWQDGSTDSLLVASKAGIYWVKVTDSCGNSLSDSISISVSAQIPVSIGPDRFKCNNDTVMLTAPAGFLNYTWSNNYNISSTTSRSVIVNPNVDTAYYLKAEKTPGCFGFDTIAISVKTSPRIYLGVDTSICENARLVLNAGPGFVNYMWNNGSSGSAITINSIGSYSVVATTNDGCKSYDSLQLVSIYSNPGVRLDKDSTLCFGASRTLDAGANFVRYLWNNGSQSERLTINAVGKYSVQVQDSRGCTGTDSVAITKTLSLPVNFLPADASICSYGSLVIASLASYNSYLWNTNDITRSITIKQPGRYILRVTDNNNCSRSDTLVVTQKQCLEGFYIATAFTPNRDGKNDVFKPQLFGNVISYRFTIYNRYGGKLFETTDLQQGWNGNSGGGQTQTNGYAWTCQFQLAGQAERQEKGIVLIVR